MTKKYILPLIALVALFLIPTFTSAQDVDPDRGSSCAVLNANLRYGMRDSNANGNSVSILQDFLHSRGYLSAQPTGFFGSMTRTAVISFQNAYGISATPPGFVGSITRAKITAIDCSETPETPPIPVPTPIPPQPPIPVPQPVAPYIRSIEAKAAPAGTIYSGERAYINGSGLRGSLTIKIGVKEPQYVSTTGYSDSYAEFTVPSRVESAVSIVVTNSSGITSNFYQVNIAAPSSPELIITTSSPLPNAKVGTYYTKSIEAAGVGNYYQWSISSGSLPPGIELHPANCGLSCGGSGMLSGSPTVAGTYVFEVKLTSSSIYGRGPTAYQRFSLTVDPSVIAVPLPLVITTSSPLPNTKVGSYYSAAISATGGEGDYSWSLSSGSLPPGLNFNIYRCLATTGCGKTSASISGAPTVAGTYTFEVQVYSASAYGKGPSAYQQFTLTVESVADIIPIPIPPPTSNATITVIYPKGGEYLTVGKSFDIQWSNVSCGSLSYSQKCGDSPSTYHDIQLLTYGGAEYPRTTYTITRNVFGTSYVWNVGNVLADIVYDGAYTIQVCQSGTTICDQSDGYFKIIGSMDTPSVRGASTSQKEEETNKVLNSLRSLLQELSRQIGQ